MNARDLKDTYASYCRNLDEALTLLDKVSFSSILVSMTYNRTSLVGTPGDRQNVYSLSGIRINQYHLY